MSNGSEPMRIHIFNGLQSAVRVVKASDRNRFDFPLHATAVAFYNIAEVALKQENSEILEILDRFCIVEDGKIDIDQKLLRDEE